MGSHRGRGGAGAGQGGEGRAGGPEPGLSELSAGGSCLHSEVRDRSSVQSGREGGRQCWRLEGGVGPGCCPGVGRGLSRGGRALEGP